MVSWSASKSISLALFVMVRLGFVNLALSRAATINVKARLKKIRMKRVEKELVGKAEVIDFSTMNQNCLVHKIFSAKSHASMGCCN